MTPVDPATFAAELISRLEKLQLELESRHSLEQRLQQIREVVLAPPRQALCPALPQLHARGSAAHRPPHLPG